MKGFVPTPEPTVDLMVARLFERRAPWADARLLDPGCGTGEFIAGVLRACEANDWPVPQIVGVELHPERAAAARARFAGIEQVEIRTSDFLASDGETFDFVVGNPPYVSILGLDPAERAAYRARFRSARGRFDLYALFFEHALRQLRPGGVLVFVTPEKFAYVETGRALRRLLMSLQVAELRFADEETFPGRVTYPLISTILACEPSRPTVVVHRDGTTRIATLPGDDSWLPAIEGYPADRTTADLTLADVCARVSCGVATGADDVFVLARAQLPAELAPFAHPTLSGRQIAPDGTLRPSSVLLAPYDARGQLMDEASLGALARFLAADGRAERLAGRSCASRKPWYAFHDSFPIDQMRRPKLLCKDISEAPFFVRDDLGEIVPRHSVYYVVPKSSSDLQVLGNYLNSAAAAAWLRAHCQRAANGFLRLQSHVLKRLPIPAAVAEQLDGAAPTLGLGVRRTA